jgi:hypothetical protein
MSDPDHERSAELCRQAARPVLRQRPDMVIPKSQPAAESSPDSDVEQPAAASPGSVAGGGLGILDYGVWFRLPR